MSGGRYWHYGLSAILDKLQEYGIALPSHIELTVNSDGVQPYNRSKQQFWPILATIKGFKFSPFVIGIYCGVSKPTNFDFLDTFVDELFTLVVNGYNMKINLKHAL